MSGMFKKGKTFSKYDYNDPFTDIGGGTRIVTLFPWITDDPMSNRLGVTQKHFENTPVLVGMEYGKPKTFGPRKHLQKGNPTVDAIASMGMVGGPMDPTSMLNPIGRLLGMRSRDKTKYYQRVFHTDDADVRARIQAGAQPFEPDTTDLFNQVVSLLTAAPSNTSDDKESKT